MRYPDVLRFARDAGAGYPLRTGLSVLAMAIGVAAVVVLTALGDGARRYVVDQFSALGSNLVIVLPGRSATGGFSPANALTTTPRDLTIDDAFALGRLPLGAARRAAGRRHFGDQRQWAACAKSWWPAPPRLISTSAVSRWRRGASCPRPTGTAARRWR
jgi:hypothetical protein